MNKKFIETINIENYSLLTDTGYEKINKLHKTVPYEVYLLELSDGINLKCADNHIIFNEKKDEIYLKNLKIGDKIYTEYGIKKVILIKDLGYEENMYDFELTNSENHRYFTNGILSHNTVLVEGLAQKIVNQDISPLLLNKKIISLDIAAMVAGTKYRGEFEERLKKTINEIKECGDIIVFIDEIQNVIGAGSSVGSGDASNILKPTLSNNEIQIIGATTLDEYRKYIEPEPAFSRRFQKLILDPPTKENTIIILKRLKSSYEEHHAVIYSDEMIELIVKLSDRYITDRFFPDKAIDIMDEVGSAVHSDNIEIPAEFKLREKEINEVYIDKLNCANEEDYIKAATLRNIEYALMSELDLLKKEWYETTRTVKKEISEMDVTSVVSLISGVPVNRLSSNENEILLNLENEFNKYIIGQDKAIKTISKAIKKSKLKIKNPNKPTVLFMLGNSGCGKTLSAKMLAKFISGDEKNLIRIDMGEYMEKTSASRLTGAAPGFVGYEEGGELTKKVKNKPYSVILLDEIEKAHPDVLNLLLSLFDEGHLSDSHGNIIDFKNTIIILTSNIGTQYLKDFGTGIGFTKNVIKNDEIEKVLLAQLNKTIKTELLNRIDKIVIFNPLEKSSLYKIIEIYIKELSIRLEEHGFNLTIKDSVKDLIIEKGYDDKFGARVIERTISELIEDGICDLILEKPIETKLLQADVKDGEIVYEFI